MSPLNNEQKQLLFDYCIGLTSQKETAEAEALISTSKEAAEIHSKLKAAIAPLECVQSETCPNHLAERTVQQLVQLANVRAPIKQVEKVVIKTQFWRNLVEIAAIAAAILFIAAILIPSLSYGRYQYRKHLCQRQLGSISRSIDQYCDDYDDKLPAVAIKTDEPWCAVGYQGKENHSNTRNLFLLLKLGFSSRPDKFVCPGRKQSKVIPFDISQVKEYNDFPSRKNITYSLRIMCNPTIKRIMLGGQPLMADCNPVFENASEDKFEVRLDKELSTHNSINHDRRGQNVLFCDGHVEFLKTRHAGIPQDDIFTLQNIEVYRGIERPSCETDPFLAP